MRLIDADDLIKQFCSDCGQDVENKNCRNDCAVFNLICSMPIITHVAETAHWVKSDVRCIIPVWECDKCNGVGSTIMSKFCPNCGAKMIEQSEPKFQIPRGAIRKSPLTLAEVSADDK